MTIAGTEWGRSRGASVAVLAATEPGYPVDARLGFRTVFDTTVWMRDAGPRQPGG